MSDEIVRSDHGFKKSGDAASRVKNEALHKQRHVLLHDGLDELTADFIGSTGKYPSKTTILELMEWSFGQTKKPDPMEEA